MNSTIRSLYVLFREFADVIFPLIAEQFSSESGIGAALRISRSVNVGRCVSHQHAQCAHADHSLHVDVDVTNSLKIARLSRLSRLLPDAAQRPVSRDEHLLAPLVSPVPQAVPAHRDHGESREHRVSRVCGALPP